MVINMNMLKSIAACGLLLFSATTASPAQTNPSLLQSIDVTAALPYVDLAMPSKCVRFKLDLVDVGGDNTIDANGDYLSFAFSENSGVSFHNGPQDYQVYVRRFFNNVASDTVNAFFDSLGSVAFLTAGGKLNAELTIDPGNNAGAASDMRGIYVNGYIESQRGVSRLEVSAARQNMMRLLFYGTGRIPSDPANSISAGHLRFWCIA